MPIGTYFANLALNCIFRATDVTAPGSMYLAAYDGASELASTGSYARIAIPTFGTPAAANSISNTTAATWPTATANWTAPWDHTVFIDSSSGAGNIWWNGALLAARTVLNTYVPVDQIGQLTLGFSTGVGSFFGDKLLNCLCRAVTCTHATNMFLVPFNGDPLAGGTELHTNGASRIAIPTFSAASAGSITNTSSVNWGAASADWVSNFTYMGYADNGTYNTGNIWASQPLTVGTVVLNGDVPTVQVGALVVPFS